MIVKGQIRKYIGSVQSEEEAGLLYDKYNICFWGLQVS